MRKFCKRSAWIAAVAFVLIAYAACTAPTGQQKPRLVLFVGVDVSGSFQGSGYYDDAIAFLSHYIYGHLHELGGLNKLDVVSVEPRYEGERLAFWLCYLRKESTDEELSKKRDQTKN